MSNQITDELKPCPFCGGRAILTKTDYKDYYILCALDNFCNVRPSTSLSRSKKTVIKAWNTRSLEGGRP